jgi:hypothetical protein
MYAKAKRAKAAKPELVAAAFSEPATWVIPLHVTAGDNTRGSKAKIGRAGHERRVVSRALGGARLTVLARFALVASVGGKVRVTLTRLGGRVLDDDNAVASMKYVRDCVALMMGFSDDTNSPLRFVVCQEPHDKVGVRVELSCV